MSLWEFHFATSGWQLANGVDDNPGTKPPSESEFEAMLERMGE